ncbi:MAG: hypothetical protein QGF94_03080 [Candidatus Thalassarchaeaceae archaeon]|jgi:hypothetical protein|nr:hypothetical protein [Candidatus Thalassarchaeaceae archaeon]
MSDWREQNQLSQRLFSRTREALAVAMARGCQDWPLPEPPLSDPDFPVRTPESPEKLIQIADALLEANRAAFDRSLEQIGETLIPHRLSLSADPAREGRKWLERRGDEVAERALYIRLETMLSQALDPDAPDVDRWWVTIALLNGLSANDSPISRQQGYHLMESIALARPPGTWHGSSTPGPHLLDWSEGPSTEIELIDSHPRGTYSAGWLLDRMEAADPPRPVLVEWMDLALARGTLVHSLSILSRLNRMASDGEAILASRIASLLPRAYDLDFEGANQLEITLLSRESSVRCALADALDEIIHRRGASGFDLLDKLLNDNTPEVVRIATGTLRLCHTLDPKGFPSRCTFVATHPDRDVRRRFSQTALRDYMSHDPTDTQDIVSSLWVDGDEIIRSRVRELLLHMVEEHPESLSNILQRITERGDENILLDFWRVLDVRSSEVAIAWRAHIEQGASRP